MGSTSMTTLVPYKHITKWWYFCSPLFSRVYKKYPDEPSLEEYLDRLLSERAKLCVQVTKDGLTGGSVMIQSQGMLLALFGSWDMCIINFDEFYECWVQLAKDLNLSVIGLRGRKGYKRLLEPYGFKTKQLDSRTWLFTKEVT